MKRAFCQLYPGAGASGHALIIDVDLEFAFQDVKGFVLPAMNVWRWSGLWRHQHFDQCECPAGILAVGLDRIEVANDPASFARSGLQNAALHKCHLDLFKCNGMMDARKVASTAVSAVRQS